MSKNDAALMQPEPITAPLPRRPRLQMGRIIVALMLREMATTYGKSAGGYLWAIIEPVLAIGLLAILFSLAMRNPALGTNFPLFYASGLLPFIMYSDLQGKIAASIRYSRPFLAYPSVTFMDAMIARAVLNTLTHICVIMIVMTGIYIIYDLPVQVRIGYVLTSLLMAGVLAAGVGTLNCYLITAFPVWERIWGIITRPLFLISGLFFTYEQLPQIAQNVLWYNPIFHCIGMLRRGIYPTYSADYVSVSYVMGVAITLLFFGLLLLLRNYRGLMER